ncbi:MAG: transposase, partial [Bacteroidota bacterium]
MAHARRYFEKALDNDKERAEHALKVIQLLYALEREAQEDDSIDLITLRRQKAEPILFAWKEWLGQQQGKVLPKSSIGKAINYTINLWPRLIRYTQQADYCIDNNGIENTIRPLAIGRKNYLFAGSHEAAQRAAMFYSFFACCKLHQVNPYEWLKQTLERIPDYQINKIAELLPHNYKHLP